MKIVIVEDEPFARQELVRLLNKTGRKYELMASIDSVEDSIAWFEENPHPDLVFLDIQLADGLSFDIFNSIDLRSAVIFTTAYDAYAIKAFQLNSIDYLLKPVKSDALENALSKYDKMKRDLSGEGVNLSEGKLEKLMEMMGARNFKNRFLIKIGDQIKSVETAEIAYFKAEDNVVFVVLKDGNKYIIDQTLEQLEQVLDPDSFFRLNRTYIADIKAIIKVSKYFNSRLLIELNPGSEDQVLVSRARVKEFLEWLDQ
jgi:DNA-binding LytR/AlgR family response regulator